jgi:hypothetical protein
MRQEVLKTSAAFIFLGRNITASISAVESKTSIALFFYSDIERRARQWQGNTRD